MKETKPTASGIEAKKDKLDLTEQIVRTASLIAVPVLVAAAGWYVQNALQQQTNALQRQTLTLQATSDKEKVSSEYVRMALSILQEPKANKGSQSLRPWAVDLLTSYSPVKLSIKLTDQLRSGDVTLPSPNSRLSALQELADEIKKEGP